MKYITLLAGFGLIGTIIYFGLQPAPIEKQPVTEVIEQVVTEPTSPKIEPKATVTPKKIPTKVEKVAPKPEIVEIKPTTAPIQEQPKPVEEVKVVEVPKVEVKPDYITKWELETKYEAITQGYTDVTVKGYPVWSNGVGTAYLTGCTLYWRIFLPSGSLYFEEQVKMQQQDPYTFKIIVPYNKEKATPAIVCQTFGFDKQGNEVTFKSPEIKN